MVQRKKYLFFVLIYCSIVTLSACYKRPHIQYYYDSLGYEYDLPSNDWFDADKSVSGLYLSGPEGSIKFEFVATSNNSNDAIMNRLIGETAQPANYFIDSIANEGKNMLLAKLQGNNNIESPSHLAVFPFDDNHVLIAKGYPNERFIEDFDSIFIDTVFSFVPYDPSSSE